MAKVLIDTNIILDKLSLTSDTLQSFFDELYKNKSHFIFTQQIIDEIFRNTENKLCEISNNLKSNLKNLKTNTFAGLNSDEAVKAINDNIAIIHKNINDDMKKKKEYLISFINNISDNFAIVATTEDIIKSARLRKEKGNPPSSGASIGDEIIWESVLSWGENDIIVLSKDNTWYENKTFLEYEYIKKTNKKIISIEKELSKVYDLIDIEENKKLKDIENEEQEHITQNDHQIILNAILRANLFDEINRISELNLINQSLYSDSMKRAIAAMPDMSTIQKAVQAMPDMRSFQSAIKAMPDMSTLQKTLQAIPDFNSVNIPKISKEKSNDI